MVGNVPELPAGTGAVLPRESHPSWEHTACPAPRARGVQSPGDGQWESTNPLGHGPPTSQHGGSKGERLFYDTPCSYTLLPSKKNPHTCLFSCMVTVHSSLSINISDPQIPLRVTFSRLQSHRT